MSPKTAYLKQTSEQRCKEAFEQWYAGLGIEAADPRDPNPNILDSPEWGTTALDFRFGWNACWKYLEERLLKEIQS